MRHSRHSPSAHAFFLTLPLLISGCGPRLFISDTEVYRESLRASLQLSSGDLYATQFYLEGTMVFAADVPDSGALERGVPVAPLLHYEVRVKEMTPGVLSAIRGDTLTVDFGDQVVLAFVPAANRGQDRSFVLLHQGTYTYRGRDYSVTTANDSDGDPHSVMPRLRVSERSIREMKARQRKSGEAPGRVL